MEERNEPTDAPPPESRVSQQISSPESNGLERVSPRRTLLANSEMKERIANRPTMLNTERTVSLRVIRLAKILTYPFLRNESSLSRVMFSARHPPIPFAKTINRPKTRRMSFS